MTNIDKKSSYNPAGETVVRGVLWVTLQSVFARALQLSANLALAWFLLEEDFGLFGLASTVIAFTSVFATKGINNILFYRQKRFHLWANPVHWLSVVLGLAVTVLTMLTALVMLSFFNVERPNEFLFLIGIMSLTPLINACSAVSVAKLRIEMRFGELSAIEGLTITLSTLSKIGLAAIGLGALSFAIPNVACAFVRLGALWHRAGASISWDLGIRRWRPIAGKAGILILTALLSQAILYGDYAVASNFVSRKQLGLFFFAFNYSVLGVLLLTHGLNSVLLQILARENDPKKRLSLFIRGASFASAIVFPICFLQASVSEPLAKLVLPTNYQPSILFLQLLSLGMAGRTVSWLASSMMDAQGKFSMRFWLATISSIVFLVTVLVGCLAGQALYPDKSGYGVLVGLSIAEMIFFPINSIFFVYFAIRDETSKRFASIGKILGWPLIGGAVSVLLGWFFGRMLYPHWLASAIVMVGASAAIYYLFLCLAMPEQKIELSRRLSTLKGIMRKTLAPIQQGMGRS